MQRARLVKVIAAPMLAGSLAACGGAASALPNGSGASAASGSTGSRDTRPVATAARTTLTAKADIKVTIAMKDAASSDVPPIDITGFYDMGQDTGNLAVALGPRTLTEVFTKDTLYTKSPDYAGVPADTWLATDRTTVKAHYLFRTPGNDPAAFIRQIADLTDVQPEGSDTIGQTTAKHYRGRFPTDTLTRYLAPDKTASFAAVIKTIGPFYADVWVDGSGRIVRVVVAYSAATLSSRTELDLTYSAAGSTVAVPNEADTLPGTISGGILVG